MTGGVQETSREDPSMWKKSGATPPGVTTTRRMFSSAAIAVFASGHDGERGTDSSQLGAAVLRRA